jgi:23S rRNA (adenine2503-C2)-methyltransferase
MKILSQSESSDGTLKILWQLADQATVESVVLPRALKQRKKLALWMKDESTAGDSKPETARYTACISSQVGCAMACDFCLTGKQGFSRHLTAEEIIGQVVELNKIKPISNLVFMGMGEPLQNTPNVIAAIDYFLSPQGLKLSRRKITVSTSGLVNALPALAKTGVRLAISLNASENTLRSQIMPVNRKHSIEILIEASKLYAETTRQAVMIEYVLFHGLNDSLADADRLHALAKDWDCKINLIPYNTFTDSPYLRPEPETVKAFQHSLVSRGITATVRYSGGDDIYAACGQLKSFEKKMKSKFVSLS